MITGHARESDHEMIQFKCCLLSAKSANNWSFKLVLKSVAKHCNRQSANLVIFWPLSHLSDSFLCCIQAKHELPTAQSFFNQAV